jgi:hypothetical protein
VTPLDQLSSKWPPEAGAVDGSVVVDATGSDAPTLDARSADAPADTSLVDGSVAPEAGVGTPPTNPALWSVSFGDSQDQQVYAVATDSAGNIYVAGAFSGTLGFGSGITLASAGGYDAFVAMLNPQGKGQWAVPLGDARDAGSYDQIALGVAVDAAGNVYACGTFEGTLVAGTTSYESADGQDGFVVKIGTMGTVSWTQILSGPGDQVAAAIAVTATGSSTIEGSFEDSLTANTNTTITSQGGFDGFTVQFGPGSGLGWLTQFGGVDDQFGSSVALGSANAYGAGYFAGHANVGQMLDAGVVTSDGGYDVFSESLQTNNGSLAGITRYGDPSDQYGYAIATDAIGPGHVAIAGPFAGSITFEGTPTLTSAGLHDIFLAKSDQTTGLWQWSARIGDPEEQVAYGTAIDPGGNVVVTGSLQGTATLGTSVVRGAGGNDALLAKLDPSSKPLWIERFGDSQDQYGSAVTTVASSGGQYDIVLVGNFQGSIQLGSSTLVSQGGYDFFVAEFGP